MSSRQHAYYWGIAVDIYKDPDIPPLKNPVKDVRDVAAVLSSSYQFTEANMRIRVNEEVTWTTLFADLQHYIRTLKGQDTLVIYIAGHGFSENDSLGLLIPYDALKSDRSSFIEYSRIIERLRSVDCLHLFIMVDACFSGTLTERYKKQSLRSPFPENHIPPASRVELLRSRWVLASGRNEPVVDGDENSPFAESVIRVLNNNQNKLLPVSQLVYQVVADVGMSENHQIPYGGVLGGMGDEGGLMMLARRSEKTSQSAGDGKSKNPNTYIPRLRIVYIVVTVLAVWAALAAGLSYMHWPFPFIGNEPEEVILKGRIENHRNAVWKVSCDACSNTGTTATDGSFVLHVASDDLDSLDSLEFAIESVAGQKHKLVHKVPASSANSLIVIRLPNSNSDSPRTDSVPPPPDSSHTPEQKPSQALLKGYVTDSVFFGGTITCNFCDTASISKTGHFSLRSSSLAAAPEATIIFTIKNSPNSVSAISKDFTRFVNLGSLQGKNQISLP